MIPADLFEDPGPPPKIDQPQSQDQTEDNQGPGPGKSKADASVKIDGGDGGVDAEPDATPTFVDDGGIAYVDDDAGDGDGGFGRDPLDSKVSAGPNNMFVVINFQVIRSHPLGARLQPILLAIPEWKMFMSGSSIDPYRDTDWMLITGPSLRDTTKDAVYIHYSAPDSEIEKAITQVSSQYAKGGTMDVGVPGVKTTRFFAQGAERAFLRANGQKMVMIVPSTHAKQFAQELAKGPPTPRFKKGEAFRGRFKHPGGSVNLIPTEIDQLNMWLVPRASDGGADLYAEGECASPQLATKASDDSRNTVNQVNGIGVKLLTAGALNGYEVHAEGSTLKAHLPGSKDQTEAVIGLIGASLGVAPPKP